MGVVTYTRKKREERRTEILQAAVELAQVHGYSRITRNQVAHRVNISSGLIRNYFPTLGALRSAVMAEAVRVGNAVIVLQGLSVKDPAAESAPKSLKEKALETVTL